MPTDEPLTPMWWVKRLYKQLTARLDDVERYDAYYRGVPPRYPWLPEQAREEFRRLLDLTRSNYMGLVVDATAERMQIEGFRIGDERDADEETWRIWQANNLDSESDQAILEGLIAGQSYLLVAPNPDDPKTPLVYVEHPAQAIVEYQPGMGRRERSAGLKVWLDDWTGKVNATLYLPDGLYKFVTDKPQVQGLTTMNWVPREVTAERWPAPNPLGVVPLVELANNPRVLTGGVSEIADVISIQDRIAKTLADRLMTQDFGAFPQKWAIGFPDTDADGNPNRVNIGRNRLVTSDAAETEFGQFDAAPLDPYSAAKREDVKDIASRTRTPAQYLLGELNNVNGATLQAAESGLVSKVRQRMRTYGEGFEEAVRLMRTAAGLSNADERTETIWRNPEHRTEGELVDALLKMSTLGVPEEALWERWGASQVEIARWKDMKAEADAANLAAILKQPQPGTPPGQPGGPSLQPAPGAPPGSGPALPPVPGHPDRNPTSAAG
ncbi:MAG TPA: phage portal protein [Candidatus Binatia bacterium]|nr:phage portal protein [Candidatus Binatia bacterium]